MILKKNLGIAYDFLTSRLSTLAVNHARVKHYQDQIASLQSDNEVLKNKTIKLENAGRTKNNDLHLTLRQAQKY